MSGGTSGSSGASGGSGGSAAGTGGLGGGSDVGTPPPGDGGSPQDTPVTPPPPAGTCDYTPKANAGDIKLKFARVALPGVPTNNMAKNNGGPSVTDGATLIKFLPGKQDELFFAQKGGRVTHVKIAADATTGTVIKTLNVPANPYADCGLISMAFDPDFATNKFVYFGFCTGQYASKIARYTYDGNALSDAVDIMTWNGAGGSNTWHSVGSMGFDAQKNLWMVHGEFTNTTRAQDLSTNLGKLIRIVPSRMAGKGDYTPAADNPFAADAKPKSAIYAYGLRSPWKAIIDNKGRYIFGDVGNQRNEEVNVVTAKNQNFGWGMSADTSGPCNAGCISPVTYWKGGADPYRNTGDLEAQATTARVVWVGAQYGDCGNDKYRGAMTGVITFGDLMAGWVRGLVLDDEGKKAKDVNLITMGTSRTGISSMEQGPDGYIYATTFGTYGGDLDGVVPALWRVTPE